METQAGPPILVRIVGIDWYMSPPVPGLDVCFSYFEGTPIHEVPVIRVFGSTPAGQKACVHVHKVRTAAAAREGANGHASGSP